MRQNVNKINEFLKRHWKIVLIAVAVLALAGAGAAWGIYNIPENDSSQRVNRDTSTQEEEPITEPMPLTGEEVDPDASDQPITGVMIENSPNARPQTGLDSADIVFEAVAEGGITRFLALFQSQTPDTVGPIRSLRVYFLDWAMSFDAGIAHVGGSGQALQQVGRRMGAKSLNQMEHSGPYYRSGDRPSPHNMYSSINDLQNLQNDLGYSNNDIPPFERSDDDPAEESEANRITINYSSSQYQAQFRYRASENDYRRYMAGNPHIDRATGNPITVDNVVVIKMPTGQDGRYAVMETTGNGDAVLFKNGEARDIRWQQDSYNDRIELLNGEGDAVALNRGQTWFAILPEGKPLDY